VDHLIGFTPTTFAIHPRGQRVVPITVRVGGRTYRYTFGNAAAAVGPSADIYLRNMIRARRYPSPEGIFLDRRLTAAERRYVTVRADLGRDADVLVAAREHPACASGVSRAAARGIAAGTIRTWSAAGVAAPSSGDGIALRRAGDGTEGFVEPRFGAGPRMPRGARAARDGGLSEAATGNPAIAAVYLYGFEGTASEAPLSHVELAVLFRPEQAPDSNAPLLLIGQVASGLCKGDVPVLVLNTAPLSLQFDIVSKGRRILVTDEIALAVSSHEVVPTYPGDG